jgi:hypothetical protein
MSLLKERIHERQKGQDYRKLRLGGQVLISGGQVLISGGQVLISGQQK